LQWFAQGGTQPAAATEVALPELTQRERAVLELVAAGCDNPTIADRLTVTEKTVRNYVSQLLKKLEVSDRRAAAEKARRAGLDEV
jgi:DNA-binding NarL/FixJ family response regulator